MLNTDAAPFATNGQQLLYLCGSLASLVLRAIFVLAVRRAQAEELHGLLHPRSGRADHAINDCPLSTAEHSIPGGAGKTGECARTT
jgi:hypothetical protein